jgi:hypothetical protein
MYLVIPLFVLISQSNGNNCHLDIRKVTEEECPPANNELVIFAASIKCYMSCNLCSINID